MEEYRLGELFEIKYLDRRRAWMKEIDYFYDYNEKTNLCSFMQPVVLISTVKPITIMRNFQLFTISVIFLRILHLYLKLLLYFCKCIYLFYIYSMAKKDVNRLKIMLAVTKRSNKWLAEMLGKDQATISKWCTNTCQPDLETLIRISDLLKVDVNDLLNKECIKE